MAFIGIQFYVLTNIPHISASTVDDTTYLSGLYYTYTGSFSISLEVLK